MAFIKFYSTNKKAPGVSFSEALLKGLAPDKGLYMPEMIPAFSWDEIRSFTGKKYHEIAFEVISRFLKEQIDDNELLALIKDAYNFSVPLERVYGNNWVMRLDQGPTASFKDFAARMMGRLMQYYIVRDKRNLLILTATSGDTGSAIANAFYKLDNIEVVVLFPENEISGRQRKQMTTLGENVRIIALEGKFDDCQALVKEAFSDPDLDGLSLSSANSINIGRLIPQIVYYFFAFANLGKGIDNDNVIFSVPSGNFGDMMGGVLAKRMGLPVRKFVVAVNENDEFPAFLYSGNYSRIEPSRNCLSSAMNVGHPSNLARLVALYGGFMDEKGQIIDQPDMEMMREDIFSVSVTDEQTRESIREAYNKYEVILEPHGAVGWKGLTDYFKMENLPDGQLSVTLETAHPAKFPEEIRQILNIDPDLPDSLTGLEGKVEYCTSLDNNYQQFKTFLQENYF
ncbi:MAG TPA: threonine synthase [Bacteroidales bacterium]|nr:threonine synthase [Bacteroidales bacterium]